MTHITNAMRSGAFNYAMADRSDPFSFSRAMSHLKNGIAGFRFEENGYRNDAFYTATHYFEERELKKADGSIEKYKVSAYKDMKRP